MSTEETRGFMILYCLDPSGVADKYQERLQGSLTGPINYHKPFRRASSGSHTAWETSQKVTHPKITPQQARLTVEFLRVGFPKRKVHL